MMRSVVSVMFSFGIIILSVLVSPSFGQTTGQAQLTTQAQTAAPNDTSTLASSCAGFTNQTECCQAAGCKYVSCFNIDDNTTKIEKCVEDAVTSLAVCGTNNNLTDVCSVSTQAPVVTTSSATQNADLCVDHPDNETCCADASNSCVYISCTDTTGSPHQGCHGNRTDFSAFCQDGVYTITCTKSATTPVPSVSTTTNNTSTTELPTDTRANTGVQEQGQRFDGASFIGGIVLCVGVLIIAFVGRKFYKTRTEKNYNSL